MPSALKVGVLTAGGDSPGLNAAIRGLLGLVAAGILYFSAAATTVWYEVARATVDSVKDGPVDGKNCVSELGKIAPVPSEDPSAAAVSTRHPPSLQDGGCGPPTNSHRPPWLLGSSPTN